jgi:hypothetical protein
MPIGRYSLKRRAELGLTALEVQEQQSLIKHGMNMIVLAAHLLIKAFEMDADDFSEDEEDDEEVLETLLLLTMCCLMESTRASNLYMNMSYVPLNLLDLDRHVRNNYFFANRTIASFESEAPNIPELFIFRDVTQLQRVHNAMLFPPIMKSSDGREYQSEEVFLIGLMRLKNTVATQSTICNYFPAHNQPSISRAFDLFVKHVHSMFMRTMVIERWVNLFDSCRQHIWEKIKKHNLFSRCGNILDEDGDLFSIFGFIDCKCVSTCRPGSGPARPGQ